MLALISAFFALRRRRPRQQLGWEVRRPIDTFDIEITSIGTEPIWYGSPDDRHREANPFYIDLDPPAEVREARIIAGDVDDNGFCLIKNGLWNRGRVECRWRRLSPGERVVVRVDHVRMGKGTVGRLTGELSESLVPRQLKCRASLVVGKRVLCGIATSCKVGILAFLWAWCALRALKTEHYDRQLVKVGLMPKGVIPSFFTYWRREVIRYLRLLMGLIRLVSAQ
jgi:hypothetical protein